MRLISLVAIASAFLASSAAGLAQEATPESGTVPRAPAHVHAGTCGDVGELVSSLAGAGYGLPVGGDPEATLADAEQVGPKIANAAMVSVTALATPLDQLTDENHVIDVHRTGAGDEAATRIACGAVGGFRTGSDLVFGLMEENGSRYGGTAWLRDQNDGSTTGSLFLVSGLTERDGAAGVSGTDGVATPAIDESRRIERAGLIIVDSAFAASSLRLLEDVPTVLSIYNHDDQPYYFRIGDLVSTVELPANQLTVIEFTTPTAEAYAALLLSDEDDAAGLDLLPVVVE